MIGNMEAGDCADYGADAVEERVGRGPAPDGKGDNAVVAETAGAPVSRDGFAREDALLPTTRLSLPTGHLHSHISPCSISLWLCWSTATLYLELHVPYD
jgi:hypothetical protein